MSRFPGFFVTLVLLAASSVASAQETYYRYDAAGRLTRVIFANGQNISYTYGPDGKLIGTTRLLEVPDGGFGDEDAAAPDALPLDASAADAAAPDGAVGPTDAGTSPNPDASVADAGMTMEEEGCGCSSVPSEPGFGGLSFGLVLASLWFLRRRRGLRYAAYLAIAPLALGSSLAEAHVVSPQAIVLFVAEGSDVPTATFTVADQATCSALISVTSMDPNIATVTPGTIDAITAVFTVAAGTTPGMTVIDVRWVGASAPNPPCADVAGSIVTVEVRPRPGRDTHGSRPASGTSGDPVNTFTGELVIEEAPDLDLGGPMPLRFERFHASHLRRSFIVGVMGDNWRHNFEWRTYWVGNVLYVVNGRGKVWLYLQQNGDWQLQTATDQPLQVVQDGQEILVGDPLDQLTYRFAATGLLSQITDRRGNAHSLSYTNNRLSSVTDGVGRTLSFTYEVGGHLVSVTDGTRVVSFAYTDENLTGVTDPLFQTTSLDYDLAHNDPGLLTAIRRPRGNTPYTQTYDNLGRVATQTDAFGYAQTFTYASDTTTINQPGLTLHSHVHNMQGELVSATDAAGFTINLGNDGNGRRTQVTDRTGAMRLFSYDAQSGLPSTTTDARGRVTSSTYVTSTDANGMMWTDLSRIDHPDGTFETFVHDGAGNLTRYTDRARGIWTFTYAAGGLPQSMTDPDGGVTTYGYNTDRTPTSITGPTGELTTYAYDSLRRLVEEVGPGGDRRTWIYDDLDRLTSRTDVLGETVTYAYDANGNRTSITAPGGLTVQTSFDDMDRSSSVTDADGQSVNFSLDDLGRLESFTTRAGDAFAFEVEATGAVTAMTDPSGERWAFGFDADLRLTSITDPAGNITGYAYDAEGEVSEQRSPRGHAEKYAYDEVGRIASVTDGLGHATSYTYGGLGFLSSVTLPGGASASFERNSLGRITSIVGPDGERWDHGYDAAGRLSSRTDPLGRATTYALDPRGFLGQTTFPAGLGTMDVIHDARGNLLSRTFSDGTMHAFTYDANRRRLSGNRLSLSYDARGDITQVNGLLVGRSPAARIESLELATGRVISYRYGPGGRLERVSDWAGGSIDFTYDARGLVETIVRSNGVTTTQTHDPEGRIASSAEGTLASYQLVRDARGHIVEATRDVLIPVDIVPGTTSLAYDAAAQIDGAQYDAMGRLLDDGTRTFVWRLDERVREYTETGTTVRFDYDGMGLASERVSNRGTDELVWNYALGLPSVSVLRRDGMDLRYFVHTPEGRLLYSIEASDGQRRFFHFDEMGNTLFLTDDGGAITDRYVYGPFGELMAAEGNTERLFTYQGRFGVMQEGDSGLYFMRQRIYDARTMRFISRDPRPLPLDPRNVDPYQYAFSNPLFYVDLTGQDARANVESGLNYGGVGVTAVDEFVAKPIAQLGRYLDSGRAYFGGSKVSSALGWAGAATTVASQGLELVKLNENLDEAEKAFLGRSEIIWRRWKRAREELSRLRMGKNPISDAEYRRRSSLINRIRDRALDDSRDEHWNDSVNAGFISVGNMVINVVPFGGVAVEGVYNTFVK